MSKKRFIDRVSVTSPCGENWDEMNGNAQVRFCSHCAKNVTNISEMTASDARRFVASSNGNICIRIVREAQSGRIVSVERQLHQISRTPALATGLMMATLAVSTVNAQNDVPIPVFSDPAIELSVTAEKTSEVKKESFVSIKGTIKDLDAKVASKTTSAGVDRDVDDEEEEEGVWLGFMLVRLISSTDPNAREVTADVDEDGNYEFTDVPPGLYEIRIDPNHMFKKKVISNVLVVAGHVTDQDISLRRSGGLESSAGFLAVGGAMALPMFENELVRAATYEDVKTVRNILRAGADPNGIDNSYGKVTALFQAVERNDLPMAKLLISYGAKVNVRDESGNAPISMISQETPVELVRLLISRGADANEKDEGGYTPLMDAARVGNLKVMQLLIELGADLSATDKEGNTPLMIAASSGEIDSVQLLLEAGADVGTQNKVGENAFDVTADKKVEELLIKYGSRITQPEYSTATPRLPDPALDKVKTDEADDEDDEVNDGPAKPEPVVDTDSR